MHGGFSMTMFVYQRVHDSLLLFLNRFGEFGEVWGLEGV